MTSEIKIKDQGADSLVKRLTQRAPRYVDVGILGEESHEGGDLTVAAIAAIHEFGLGVPRRSWLRDAIAENEQEIRGHQIRLAREIAKGKDKGQALKELGALIQGMIQARIAEGIEPPNAPGTIAQKGSSTPLIDTGQLRSSITHRVE